MAAFAADLQVRWLAMCQLRGSLGWQEPLHAPSIDEIGFVLQNVTSEELIHSTGRNRDEFNASCLSASFGRAVTTDV